MSHFLLNKYEESNSVIRDKIIIRWTPCLSDYPMGSLTVSSLNSSKRRRRSSARIDDEI